MGAMAGVDADLLAGSRLLASGTWRASHEAFETAWHRSEGEGRDLLQALAQLAAALLKWSEGNLEPAATILGRVRRRLEGLPSHVSQVDVETLESTVLELQERLALPGAGPGAGPGPARGSRRGPGGPGGGGDPVPVLRRAGHRARRADRHVARALRRGLPGLLSPVGSERGAWPRTDPK